MDIIVKQCLSFLKIVGANPFIDNKCAVTIYVAILSHQFLVVSLLVMTILDNMDDMNVVGEISTALIGVYQMIAKYITILVHKKDIRKMIYLMDNFWPIDIFGAKCERSVKGAQILVTKVCRSFFIIFAATFIAYCSKPLLLWDWILPVEWYDFCDQTRRACFALHYIMQIFSTTSMYFIIMGFDAILFSLLCMAYCELDKIKYGLVNLKVDEQSSGDESEVLAKIGMLVKQHNLVLQFIDMSNNVYSTLLLNQIASSVGATCVGIYALMIDGFDQDVYLIAKHIIYILTVGGQIFSYCLAGQFITEQAENIADMAYQSEWHVKYQPKLTKSINMIISRAQKKTEIVAGGMFTLDLNTFTKVLQTAYSLLTLMQTFQEQRK